MRIKGKSTMDITSSIQFYVVFFHDNNDLKIYKSFRTVDDIYFNLPNLIQNIYTDSVDSLMNLLDSISIKYLSLVYSDFRMTDDTKYELLVEHIILPLNNNNNIKLNILKTEL